MCVMCGFLGILTAPIDPLRVWCKQQTWRQVNYGKVRAEALQQKDARRWHSWDIIRLTRFTPKWI